jgi:hypothetical protein
MVRRSGGAALWIRSSGREALEETAQAYLRHNDGQFELRAL